MINLRHKFNIKHDFTSGPADALKAHLNEYCPSGWKTITVERQTNGTTDYLVEAVVSEEIFAAALTEEALSAAQAQANSALNKAKLAF